MAGQIVHINKALFQELCDLWEQEKTGISVIIERLRQQFGIEQCLGWECLVLYGRTQDNEMIEHIVGWLVAIAPGIVILDTKDDDYLRPLSGLLERSEPCNSKFFGLRPFSSVSHQASLSIRPSTFPEKTPRYKICPAWIEWQIGTGQGESYMASGIEPGRWEVLSNWFDKWLPKP